VWHGRQTRREPVQIASVQACEPQTAQGSRVPAELIGGLSRNPRTAPCPATPSSVSSQSGRIRYTAYVKSAQVAALLLVAQAQWSARRPAVAEPSRAEASRRVSTHWRRRGSWTDQRASWCGGLLQAARARSDAGQSSRVRGRVRGTAIPAGAQRAGLVLCRQGSNHGIFPVGQLGLELD
jgi:hypothetical protein